MGAARRPPGGAKLSGETHEVAQRKVEQMDKLKSALGLTEVKEGDAFDRDLQVGAGGAAVRARATGRAAAPVAVKAARSCRTARGGAEADGANAESELPRWCQGLQWPFATERWTRLCCLLLQ